MISGWPSPFPKGNSLGTTEASEALHSIFSTINTMSCPSPSVSATLNMIIPILTESTRQGDNSGQTSPDPEFQDDSTGGRNRGSFEDEATGGIYDTNLAVCAVDQPQMSS